MRAALWLVGLVGADGLVIPGATPDVGSGGLCCGGAVRLKPSPGKGHGAFAERYLFPYQTLDTYAGEVITLRQLRARYGRAGEVADADAEWHAEWVAARRCRGVGATGAYVFKVSDDVYIDAEDPKAGANWTRFLNHAAEDDANLASSSVEASAAAGGGPRVRFAVQSEVAPGDELCFSYGPGFFEEGEMVK